MFSAFKNLFKKNKKFPTNVIITAPHGSSKVPVRIFTFLTRNYQLSPRLLLNFSDYGTKYLVEDVPENQKVVAKYGRIIGDPNRSREAPDLIRFEDFGGIPIFREKFQKRMKESWFKSLWIKKLLSYSYDPFHEQIFCTIKSLVANPENDGKPIILIDVHDTGNRILGGNWREDTLRKGFRVAPVELSTAPDLQISETQNGTAPQSFINDFKEILSDKLGIEEKDILVNQFFQGGYITRRFGDVENNRRLKKILNGREIITMQIEFNRGIYLDEVSQRTYPTKIRHTKNSLMDTICEICEDIY